MAKRVIIGMSGGVDSSVAAALLQRSGYEVIGVTFQFINDFDPTDAKNVCDKLGIEHHVIDYRNEFKDLVIDRFINDYKSGITPNPCVFCNKNVKIKFLYEQMQKLNCDYMATGHYARMERSKLYRSVDLNKDQTYFLSEVPRDMLMHILFPLEGIDKEEVRKIAEEVELEVANKKDSTDVCFIKGKFSDYVASNIDNNPGDVIEIDTKKVIGKHKGLAYYTIGQRKGLDIGGMESRLFVVGKNVEKNILYVSKDEEYLNSDECIIKNANIISYHHPAFCTAKFRYRSNESSVAIEYLENDKIRVMYPEKVKSVTPGQTCALYLGSECLGSGIIEEVRKNGEKLWYL